MSRIGKMPIPVPAGVEVKIDGRDVEVKGPKGTLSRTITEPITIRREADELIVERPNDERTNRALHGLTRTLVANMVVGVGYRVIMKSPTQLEFALGFSHPVVVNAPDGVTFNVETATRFSVFGIDKQVVGQVAANIRKIRQPEPYKGKGVRYAGEHVRRKAGKVGK